jgi:hypothetical protein
MSIEMTFASVQRRVALALLGAALLSGPAAAQSTSAEAQNVQIVIKRLFDGMRARDTAMMRSTMDSTARLIDVDTTGGRAVVRVIPVGGWLASVARPRPQVLDERIYDPQILVEDNLAQAWVKYDFFIGDKFSHCGVDAFMLSKGFGGWKITQLADTRKSGGCGTPGSGGK